MPEIKTANDWWNAVYDNWDNLYRIITHHISPAEPAYDPPCSQAGIPTMRIVAEELIHLRDERDGKLARYFNAAWGMASEEYAWSVPGWGVLCDLCSEEWALNDEEPVEVVSK